MALVVPVQRRELAAESHEVSIKTSISFMQARSLQLAQCFCTSRMRGCWWLTRTVDAPRNSSQAQLSEHTGLKT